MEQINVNGRKKVGLALSGGVVRGFAHIGALSVLEEAEVPIDLVAGASVGAIMAAFYCAGMKLCHIKELAAEMKWTRLSSWQLSREGLFSFAKLERWIVEILGDLYFEDLAIPLAIATTDMETGECVILDQGPLALAIRASCSVPGLVTPVRINGRILGDGGISNNLPVSALRQMGADYVIGVDIFRHFYPYPLGPLGRGLAAIEIMVRQAGGGVHTADCLICPQLSGLTFVRFSQRHKLMKLGEEAAMAELSCIRQALKEGKTAKDVAQGGREEIIRSPHYVAVS